MDPKTLGTIILVFLCVLLLPLGIGVVGGIFGLIGSVIGTVFGAIGGLIGIVFGLIGGIFGAIFGIFDWIFGGHFHGHWPFGFLNWNFSALVILVLVILMMARSKTSRS